jgi:UDP-glucose-4-epimerase GalE
MKILVTGGAGYIGSHACKLLKEQGHTVVVFDNLERGSRHAVKWGEFILGDLRNKSDILQAMEGANFDAVMHFAAYAYVGESVEKPGMYLENNIYGTLNLLNAMNQCNVKTLIFSSTCAVYGSPDTIPVTEKTGINPESPYGLSKHIAEKLIFQYQDLGLINPIIFRYFNVIGSDPDCEIGEEHDPETHILPIALEVANGDRDAFHVFGKDYNTKDGTCIRDYVHVLDLVQAHIDALKIKPVKNKQYIYNLGNDIPYSVMDIVSATERVTNKPIPVIYEERRSGDAEALYSSSVLIRKELGWYPKFPDIDSAILHAWNWIKK